MNVMNLLFKLSEVGQTAQSSSRCFSGVENRNVPVKGKLIKNRLESERERGRRGEVVGETMLDLEEALSVMVQM